MKAVHVFFRGDEVGDGLFVHVAWQRRLDQDTVDIFSVVEVFDVLFQRRFFFRNWERDVGGTDAQTSACFDF